MKWVGTGGGCWGSVDSLLHDDRHGTVWLILTRFLFWDLAPWFVHAHWKTNSEACIFVPGSNQRQKEVAGWPRTSRCFYVAITAGNLRAVFPNYRSRYSCVFCSFARNIQSLKKATLIGFLTAIRVLVWPSTFYASLYKLALESQYIPLSKKLGDRRFFSHFHLSSHILQYYFMSLSEYQMHFQDCPPASRQSKLFCTVM